MQTLTQSSSYTVADVKKVLDSFAAEFAMMAQSTGLRSRENVDQTVADLKEFAMAGYLREIHVTLFSAHGAELRAARYLVSEAAEGWTTGRPGNSLWPYTPGGELSLDVLCTQKYLNESAERRDRFRQGLRGFWGASELDFSHSDLTSSYDRCFALNGWGMQKFNFQ